MWMWFGDTILLVKVRVLDAMMLSSVRGAGVVPNSLILWHPWRVMTSLQPANTSNRSTHVL
jgi:hypothetical protein